MYTIEELKKITWEKGLTYAELSRRSGVPEDSIKQIFRGRVTTPRYDTICALYDGLGIEVTAKVEEKKEYQTLFESLSERNQTLAIVYMQGLLASEGKGLAVVIPLSKNAIN